MIVASTLQGCARATPVKATYCVGVKTADRSDEEQLSALIARFAEANGVPLWGGDDPGGRQFKTDKVVFGISFAGLGEKGSLLDMFYRGRDGDELRTKLDAFVKAEIDPKFKVTPCSELGVPDPELYGVL